MNPPIDETDEFIQTNPNPPINETDETDETDEFFQINNPSLFELLFSGMVIPPDLQVYQHLNEIEEQLDNETKIFLSNLFKVKIREIIGEGNNNPNEEQIEYALYHTYVEYNQSP